MRRALGQRQDRGDGRIGLAGDERPRGREVRQDHRVCAHVRVMEQAVRPLGVLIGHLALGIVRMRGCAQVRYAVLQTMQLPELGQDRMGQHRRHDQPQRAQGEPGSGMGGQKAHAEVPGCTNGPTIPNPVAHAKRCYTLTLQRDDSFLNCVIV
jgi:hypothetical protein